MNTNNNFNYVYPTYPDYLPQGPVPELNYMGQNNTKAERLEKFDSLVRKYEINPEYAIKLRQLEGFEILTQATLRKFNYFINSSSYFTRPISSSRTTYSN